MVDSPGIDVRIALFTLSDDGDRPGSLLNTDGKLFYTVMSIVPRRHAAGMPALRFPPHS